MNNATSMTLQKGRAAFGAISRAISYGALMALPLSGLVLFFEMTAPAKVMHVGVVPTQIASGPSEPMSDGASRPWRGRATVARFAGVSAERRPDKGEPAMLTAVDAEHVLSQAPYGSLRPGFYTEFINKERHRIALLIVNREPIVDSVVPDNARLMDITEASTQNVMSFAWGHWLYKVEIEDKGVEPDVVVQKVL